MNVNTLPDHPRLLLRTGALAAEIEADPVRRRLLGHMRRRAEKLLEAAPPAHEMKGRRLLHVSRAAIDRVSLWAFLGRLDGNKTYVRRAEREMRAIAAFPDWNPDHFLDVAEMTMALALGYDWLYDALAPEARAEIGQAIVGKGLLPSLHLPTLLPTGQPGDWWVAGTNNWTQVCHGGLVLGALAVAEKVPEIAAQIVARAAANVPRVAACYEPDGVYPEGPSYWAYGTTYHVLWMEALRANLNDDGGLRRCRGLLRSVACLAEIVGPSDLAFNYADNPAELPVEAAFFWLAARGASPGLAHRERRRLERQMEERERQGETYSSGRFDVPLLLWAGAPDAAEAAPPLNWMGASPCPLAVHRSSWDAAAVFVAVKGGRASESHGHMDAGTFVLEADGIRWADDLGQPDYHHYETEGVDIWNLRSPEGRWAVLAAGPKTHNTVFLDGAGHDPQGAAVFARFSAAKARSVLDMTACHEGRAVAARRGVALLGDRRVLIQDELEGVAAGTPVRWTLLTRAKLRLEENAAVLEREGRTLRLAFDSPSPLRLEVREVDAVRERYDSRYPGFRLLRVWATVPPGGAFRLRAVFRPDSGSGADEPLGSFEPCEEWAD